MITFQQFQRLLKENEDYIESNDLAEDQLEALARQEAGHPPESDADVFFDKSLVEIFEQYHDEGLFGNETLIGLMDDDKVFNYMQELQAEHPDILSIEHAIDIMPLHQIRDLIPTENIENFMHQGFDEVELFGGQKRAWVAHS